MTTEERYNMYLEKKQFVENLNEVFRIEPGCPTVEGVSYEVWTKTFAEDKVDEREWIIVHFSGGGKSVKLATCNSNIANYKVIGTLLLGGYYLENNMYQAQSEEGYSKVDL